MRSPPGVVPAGPKQVQRRGRISRMAGSADARRIADSVMWRQRVGIVSVASRVPARGQLEFMRIISVHRRPDRYLACRHHLTTGTLSLH